VRLLAKVDQLEQKLERLSTTPGGLNTSPMNSASFVGDTGIEDAQLTTELKVKLDALESENQRLRALLLTQNYQPDLDALKEAEVTEHATRDDVVAHLSQQSQRHEGSDRFRIALAPGNPNGSDTPTSLAVAMYPPETSGIVDTSHRRNTKK
jgi:hypothetical protein